MYKIVIRKMFVKHNVLRMRPTSESSLSLSMMILLITCYYQSHLSDLLLFIVNDNLTNHSLLAKVTLESSFSLSMMILLITRSWERQLSSLVIIIVNSLISLITPRQRNGRE